MLDYCVKTIPRVWLERAENFNWCTVPKHGQDAVLFAGVALLTACLFSGQFFALAVLLAGAQARSVLQKDGYRRNCIAVSAQASELVCGPLAKQPALPWLLKNVARRRARTDAGIPHQLWPVRQCAGEPVMQMFLLSKYSIEFSVVPPRARAL